MLQSNLALLTETWAFGADDVGIWRNDGEDYTNWRALAGLPRGSWRNSRWLVADIDKLFAHLLHQRAPVVALVVGESRLIVKVLLGNHEFVSLQRFGYESSAKGAYGAGHAAELRYWLSSNGWKLRTSVGGCGYYDVLPFEAKLTQWSIQVPKALAADFSPLCMAGREYCEPGEYADTEHYDIKSAYAACAARLMFPEPLTLAKVKPRTLPDARRLIARKNGAARVKMRVPPDTYGILPLTTPTGIDWTRQGGVIDGTWATNELRYAIGLGAELLQCEWVIIGASEANYLESFAIGAFEEKEAAKSDRDLVGARFWKRLFNATVGRLAAEGDVYTAHLVPYGTHAVPPPRKMSGIMCFHPYFFWLRSEHYPGNGNRLWTGIIIAEQRTILHRALTLSNGLYGFTDSVICRKGDFSEEIGTSLGMWEKQGQGKAIIRNVGTYQVGEGQIHARGIEAAAAEAALLGEPIKLERRRKWAITQVSPI
jgi:hypothetical protein